MIQLNPATLLQVQEGTRLVYLDGVPIARLLPERVLDWLPLREQEEATARAEAFRRAGRLNEPLS